MNTHPLSKKTLVLGATPRPDRYAFLAVRQLVRHGHEVVALGIQHGNIDGVPIQQGRPELEGVDTVTLYVNPTRLQEYEQYLLDLHPRRIIFNPGTESFSFMRQAREAGIEAFPACTLVLLSTGQY